jgi:hypothetical protein
MPLFFWFFVSKKGPDEWRGLFFARSRHNRLLLSFLSMFVGCAERCGLKNFGCLWRATAIDVQTFQKKGRYVQAFGDVEWMLTQSG